jgi:DNA polymerase-3 subunit delta
VSNEESTKKALIFSDFSTVAAEIRNGKVKPVYLITGDEDFLTDKLLTALKKKVLTAGCEEVDSYYSDRSSSGISFDELRERIYTPPFISMRRLTIIKNTGLFSQSGSDAQEKIVMLRKIIEEIPEFACLVVIETKIDKRKKPILESFALRGDLVEVNRQTDDSLCRWVAGILQKEDIKITVSAVSSLVDRCDRNMRTIESELKKIILYCRRSSICQISIEIIDLICIPDIRGSVFHMTDAIGFKRPDIALEILDKLMSLKEPVTRIRFMMSRHFRHLICAKEIGRAELVSGKLKVMPFVARNLVKQSAKFQMKELLDIYDSCFESDMNVKTGKMEERLSMEWLLVYAGISNDATKLRQKNTVSN